MKKTLTLLCASTLALTTAAASEQVTLQGVPVSGSLGAAVSRQMYAQIVTNTDNFTFDNITYWVGEGENQAALVLQWNDDREAGALVWGYRFNGTATGYDMIKAIAAADGRLYFAASNSAFGYTIGGIGFDLDGDGDVAIMDGDTRIEVTDGFAENSNFDNLKAADSDDLWVSGWNAGYWSYYVSDDGTMPPTGYSNFGASSRQLANGSVDGWYYASMSDPQTTWKTLVAVEQPTSVPTLPEEFTDGFFIQNEDWLGHALGSINWVAADGTVYYNIDNKANGDTEVLGNTSQYGQIYGGHYYALSKQGTRLVIFNAKTMKVVKSFETIGGDSRAVLGVDAGKVYLSTSAGIFILNVDDNDFTLSEAAISGTAGEVGMMVRVGKYVFAAKQSTGILVIDPTTDAVVETIDEGNVGGITVSRDGSVWATARESIVRINPTTLESEKLTMPNSMVSPWFTWMADKMCADPDENALYYAYGTGSWPNSETSIGKLVINSDGSLTEDSNFAFTMPAANDEARHQLLYGAIGIDPISGYLVATTTQSGYGTNYSYNWLHYIDRHTGEIAKTTVLTSDSGENYYWFPAIPVFTDNNAPEIAIDDIEALVGETYTYAVTEFVTDTDNLPALAVVGAQSSDSEIFTIDNDGLTLTLSPVGEGTATLDITVNSNGRVAEKSVTVNASKPSGVSDKQLASVSIYPTQVGSTLNVAGIAEGTVTIFNIAGSQVASHNLADGPAIDLGNLPRGAYIVKVLSGDKSQTAKIIKL